MKIALINPGRLKKWAGSEPLNIGYIASYLESKQFKVRIFDQLAGQNIKRDITQYRPDIAGLTATTPLAREAYESAKFLRKRGILTVMGGVHASVLPEDALNHGIDIVVRGDGEMAMENIIKQGIKSGVVDQSLPKNLDEIPKPARHLMSMDFYLKTPNFVPNYTFVPSGQRSARMITSRGCIYKCTFCYNSWRKTRLLYHSAKRVIKEIDELVHKYNTRYIFFLDDNFLLGKKRLEEICSLILAKGLKVFFPVRLLPTKLMKNYYLRLKGPGVNRCFLV